MAAGNGASRKKQVTVAPMEVSLDAGNAEAAHFLDDDGRPRRTGTVWTASSHIITAVIGISVLSVAWDIAQLGWVAGPTDLSSTQKIWHSLQAIGDVTFAYSFSNILIEIQDTIKAPPPSEAKVMKRATGLGLATTTIFYMLCGCMGYAAFGEATPRNLLSGGFKPFWLLDAANVAVVVNLVGGYQVFCQPIFAFVEGRTTTAWPNSAFIAKELKVGSFTLSLFRLTWRSAFVCITTFIALLLPFFQSVVELLVAVSFWPLTVYFPLQMYIKQRKVPRGSTRWICLQILSGACFIVSIAAAVGSIADIVSDLKAYRPFSG